MAEKIKQVEQIADTPATAQPQHLTLLELEEIRASAFADDLPIPESATLWTKKRAEAYFESAGESEAVKPLLKSVWLQCLAPKPTASSLLIFFSWPSGETALDLGIALLHDIEAYEIVLPGHGKRGAEEPQSHAMLLQAMLASELAAMLTGCGKPYSFGGTSFGAILAFEAAHTIYTVPLRKLSMQLMMESATAGSPLDSRAAMQRAFEQHGQEACPPPKALIAISAAGPSVWSAERVGVPKEQLSNLQQADAMLEQSYQYDPRGALPSVTFPVLALHAATAGCDPEADGERFDVAEVHARAWLEAAGVVKAASKLAEYSGFRLREDAAAPAALAKEIATFVVAQLA